MPFGLRPLYISSSMQHCRAAPAEAVIHQVFAEQATRVAETARASADAERSRMLTELIDPAQTNASVDRATDVHCCARRQPRP